MGRRQLALTLIASILTATGCGNLDDSPSEHRPGMSFPSEEDAYRFIANRASALGLGAAELQFGPAGGVVGLRMDTAGSENEALQSQLIDELGGSDGRMFVAGQAISLREPKVDDGAEVVESAIRSCGGSYCTEDTSVMSSSFFGGKKEIGGKTVQKSPLREEKFLHSGRICPKGSWQDLSFAPIGGSDYFPPWIQCIRYPVGGGNHMSISNRYYMWAGNGYGDGFLIEGLPEQFGAVSNTPNYFVGHTEWSFKADGRVKEIDGVCTYHRSYGEGGASSSVTFAGAVPETCKRGIY